ncbi:MULTISPECIES: homocysteine S-methyltransferase [unclassified Kitasatospora]|uniref:homocysteine S-methyltransferase n=1 Tax=unclassified Kitasatospora TaxID=2633591 RepID=UPI00070991FB|nr:MULTISPECIES: homocysteine S-methyltransferase [unclassified Kitasatospora]KQV15688.1 homocysteine methyltransferase [Kitasatospora sp. Root107]KRB71666.1 homocysteine methyltransferase [Kitasatospora sp. Root187]
MAASFAEALAAGPLVLDGGLSNQLADAGHDLSDGLWSARLLADDPSAITEAHRAYFAAGAQVAITASYQASFEGFARRGVDREQAAALLGRSVGLARAAGPGWVAASVGPYGAVLADGSEYRGRYGLTEGQLVDFHRPRIEALLAAGPDVLAVETIPDTDEAAAVLRALAGVEVPVWLSFSIAGDRTRAGQPIAEAFALAGAAPEVLAVGVNCCSPADADAAVRVAARASGKPVVVYPNSGESWQGRSWQGEPTFRPDRVTSWLADGARLVGGCCRVGPAQIRALAAAVRN